VSALHFRTTIRQAVVAALRAADTLAGPRVHDTPTDPRTQFPALVVEDIGEQHQVLSGRGTTATVRRTLMLEVTAEIQQVPAFAAARDDLLAQVETALAAFTLPGVDNLQPAGYAADPPTGMGERPMAQGRQRFQLTYFTKQGSPASP
jgi:hypothetical protein